MLNFIWGCMIVVAIVFGITNGTIDDVTNALMSGAKDAVDMTISLLGIMCFWTGIMNVAKASGVVDIIAKCMSPVMKILFPSIHDQSTKEAIVMNMTANMLGMSNAATPLGIVAMEKLAKHCDRSTASDDMCMFIVINTASIQIIPSTIIAMRQVAGSANSVGIIIPVWICSICALFVGVLSAKIWSVKKYG